MRKEEKQTENWALLSCLSFSAFVFSVSSVPLW
jgi:hypothetical protein